MGEKKPSTPCRRGTRTPVGGQAAKRQEEEEGRGVSVAEALRRAATPEANGQEDGESQ